MQHGLVPIAYRPPFETLAYVDARPHGQSILQIVRSVPQLPKVFMERGEVLINGELVPRHMWAYVVPKPTRAELPIAVTMHLPLAGGSGKGTTKSIIGIVAALALVVVTAGIASGALIPAGLSSFASATFLGISGAQVLAGAVGLAGALAISALTRPPVVGDVGASTSDLNSDQHEAASASGNMLEPGGPIPRVLGTRRIFPPFVGEPIVEMIEEDEYVEAAYALNGAHDISDIRINNVPISTADDIESETTQGFATDASLTLTIRQGRTLTPQLELSRTQVDTNATDPNALKDQGTPTNSLPVWHEFVSRKSPDEIWVHLNLPAGISKDADKNVFYAIPIRMRFRRLGDSSWINVPEFHIANSSVQPMRKQIKMLWQSDPGRVSPPANKGFVEAHLSPPTQGTTGGITPSSVVTWTANSYFDIGVVSPALNEYLSNGNQASTRIKNFNLYENRAEIYLDVNLIPKGTYEIQLIQGYPIFRNGGNWVTSTYRAFGNVYDFFYYYTLAGVNRTATTITNVTQTVIVSRIVSIWNEYPVPTPDAAKFAHIAIRAQNRSIQNLSCVASGLVRDWDGSSWSAAYAASSNPATHYHSVISGPLTKTPVPDHIRDDDKLVEWRQDCIDHDWTVDTILQDMRTQDILSLLGSCGYARPYQSEVYGVVIDKSRANDSPVQVFSEMNAANFKWEKAFAQVPKGFIVTFRDDETDDDKAQTIVSQRDDTQVTADTYESISFEGIIDEGKVRARAQFDLDQANQRSTFYSIDTDIESLVCRKGDLVAVQHPIIHTWGGSARVYAKLLNGSGNIQGLTLNAALPMVDGRGGTLPGIRIRRNNGTFSVHTLNNLGPALLMYFRGDNAEAAAGATAFYDSSNSNHTITPSGTPTISYDQSAMVDPTSAGKFNGSTDYLTVTDKPTDFAFGTGDATVEFYVRFAGGMGSFQNLFDTRISGSTGNFVLSKNTSDKFSDETALASTTTLVVNTWYHLVWQRINGVAYIFVNGVMQASLANTTNYTCDVGAVIGKYPLGTSFFNGYMQGLRVTKGRGRYPTTGFTPPTLRWEVDTDVYLSTPITEDGSIDAFTGNDPRRSASLVTSGQVGTEYIRLLVAGIKASKGLKATLTLVDEGVDLERYNTPFYSTGFETGGSPSELGGSSSGSFGYHEDTSIEGRLIGQLTSGGGYVESTTGWNKTDVIASCYIKSDIVPSGADASIMGFQNGADATIAGVQISDTTGIIAAFWPLNGGVDGTFTDSVWVADQWNLVEFRLKVSSTNGAVSLKINGVTIIDERDINTSGNNIDRGSIGMGGGAVGSFDLWTLTVPI